MGGSLRRWARSRRRARSRILEPEIRLGDEVTGDLADPADFPGTTGRARQHRVIGAALAVVADNLVHPATGLLYCFAKRPLAQLHQTIAGQQIPPVRSPGRDAARLEAPGERGGSERSTPAVRALNSRCTRTQ